MHLITENKVIPDNSLVVGSPGKIVRQVSMKKQNQLLKMLFTTRIIGRNILNQFFKELTRYLCYSLNQI